MSRIPLAIKPLNTGDTQLAAAKLSLACVSFTTDQLTVEDLLYNSRIHVAIMTTSISPSIFLTNY